MSSGESLKCDTITILNLCRILNLLHPSEKVRAMPPFFAMLAMYGIITGLRQT